ncbi:hypothetical protein SUGI_0201280 [Cryptomeria japonica]|nr:hypothetical protein SUGI_0201280 [Cryptomeria japonica]
MDDLMGGMGFSRAWHPCPLAVQYDNSHYYILLTTPGKESTSELVLKAERMREGGMTGKKELDKRGE